MTTEKVTISSVLHEDQIAGLKLVSDQLASATFHLHDWAVVVVVNHKHLDPVDMFVLGQRFQFYDVRPQAVQLLASNGDKSTALIVQRQHPGIPVHELEHFMRLLTFS